MAAVTKVLVVDDSLTMRALISGALERVPDVKVVGLADGADEARRMMAEHNPDVLTLDIEMPGMNGLQYLSELMSTRPMPVIMFSTRTEAGARESVEALRLGAIDCFPKPKVATAAELDKIISKLGKRIKSARGLDVRRPAAAAQGGTPALDWNGRMVAIGADASCTKLLFDLFSAYPANCPPTLVVQHLGAGLIDTMVARLAEQVAPKVVVATDGMALEQGTIAFAPQGDAHLVLDAWPNGRTRLLPRDPVAGERPSISVLLASVAKAAAENAIGVFLAPDATDGGVGVNALAAAGAFVVASREGAGGYALSRRQATQPITAHDLPRALLKLCAK